MTDCTCIEQQANQKFTDSELIEVYCTAFEFHLNLRERFAALSDGFEVRHDAPAPELWHRLVVAASLRKFVSGSDPVYLPRVLTALTKLNAVTMSEARLEEVRKEFNALRKGTVGTIGFQIDNQKSYTAYQIVEQLLHTSYLHADVRPGVDPWKWPESTLNVAVWEGTQQYLPFMKVVYGLCCQALNRSVSELAENLPTWRFAGINDQPSEVELEVDRFTTSNPNPFNIES